MIKIKTFSICFVVILFLQIFSDSTGIHIILSGVSIKKTYSMIFALTIYTHILYLLIQRIQDIESFKKDNMGWFTVCPPTVKYSH